MVHHVIELIKPFNSNISICPYLSPYQSVVALDWLFHVLFWRLIFIFACIGLTNNHRSKSAISFSLMEFFRYIRMSSPLLNNLILGGCMLAYISIILMGINSSLFSKRFSTDWIMNIICPVGWEWLEIDREFDVFSRFECGFYVWVLH